LLRIIIVFSGKSLKKKYRTLNQHRWIRNLYKSVQMTYAEGTRQISSVTWGGGVTVKG